jgi:hypothetical protein
MLRVTVDLLPFGEEAHKRTISTFYIANDGTGDSTKGSYMARFHGNLEWDPSCVKNHSREEPVEKLLYKVLKHYYGDTD